MARKEFKLDALGNVLVVGSRYGFSIDSNGFTTVSVGILEKINEKSVRINVESKKRGLYNDPLTEVEDPKSVNVKWTKLFPVVNSSAMEDLKEWCYDTCNMSTNERLYEIIEKL